MDAILFRNRHDFYGVCSAIFLFLCVSEISKLLQSIHIRNVVCNTPTQRITHKTEIFPSHFILNSYNDYVENTPITDNLVDFDLKLLHRNLFSKFKVAGKTHHLLTVCIRDYLTELFATVCSERKKQAFRTHRFV